MNPLWWRLVRMNRLVQVFGSAILMVIGLATPGVLGFIIIAAIGLLLFLFVKPTWKVVGVRQRVTTVLILVGLGVVALMKLLG